MAAFEAAGGEVRWFAAGASSDITRHYQQKTTEHWIIMQDKKAGREAKKERNRRKLDEVRDGAGKA